MNQKSEWVVASCVTDAHEEGGVWPAEAQAREDLSDHKVSAKHWLARPTLSLPQEAKEGACVSECVQLGWGQDTSSPQHST